MPHFCLHLVTDRTAAPDLYNAVTAALDGGVDWLQVREKSAPARDLYDLTLSVGQLCRSRRVGLIVNDRLDVALAAGAAGVHLAGRSLPVTAVRAILPPGRLVGVSVHSLAEARAADAAGADYITFGSVFPTRTVSGAGFQGLAALAAVVDSVSIPVLAIGGITAANVSDVLATGCAGISLISAILADPDPEAATAGLRAALERSSARPRVPFPNVT